MAKTCLNCWFNSSTIIMSVILLKTTVSYLSKNLAIRCEGRKVDRQEERSSQPRSEFKMLGFLHTWQRWWAKHSCEIMFHLGFFWGGFFFHRKVQQTHLIGYLSQNLISQFWLRKSLLDNVVPKQILLSPIQVRITHKSHDLSQRKTFRTTLKL